MIPKIIHQIWIGKKLPPQALMDTWKMKDFEYQVWDEDNIASLNMINQDKYDYFYKKKMYYGCADIARIEILYQHGGLYIDADTKRLKNLPNEWFDNNFFAVRTNDDEQKPYRVSNSVMASEKNSSIMFEYINSVKNATKIEPCWSTIGGTTLTKIIIEKVKDDPKILILPQWTFYPINMKKIKHPNFNDAYATHLWGSKTKHLYKNKT
jgi:mannosyltransferase OCH1-like enzyme